MSDLNEFKNRLKLIREAVQAKLPDIATVLTISAKAIAERRIRDKGFGVLYSQNKIPAWFLHGKELNGKGTKFLSDHGVDAAGKQGEAKKKRRKQKGDPDPGQFDTMTNWAEFRAAQGLQIAFVDLGYSNKMWANMATFSIEERGPIVRALLGGTNTETQDKMNYNRERYGDFIGAVITEDDRVNVFPEIVAGEIISIIDNLKI